MARADMYRALAVWLPVFVFIGVPCAARAGSPCFALADNYYEQIYCELEARGKAKKLPSFYDFRKNNETTQALLLQRPARRAGIALAMPQAASQPQPPASDNSATFAAATMGDCAYHGEAINCGQRHYHLIGNRANSRLAPQALTDTNRLELPVFSGDIDSARAVENYLLGAYERYIDKMLAIGLGGVTLSWSKFYWLFQDLSARGVSFSDRFEVMYHYLKKDKAAMAVSESVGAVDSLGMAACMPVGSSYIACDVARSNYVFIEQ